MYMKGMVLISLFVCAFCLSVNAQGNGLEKKLLPVFVIQDLELARIVDGFIADAKNKEQDTPTVYNIYIDLYDIVAANEFHMILDRRKHYASLDSMVFYKNPNYHQALIKHKGVLFRTNITSHASIFNYDALSDLIKRLPIRQEAYFKDPPPDFYNLNLRGGNPFKDTILDSYYEYDGTKWHCGFRAFEDDTNLNQEIKIINPE